MNDGMNYYELLGININASEEEIKKAYKNMMKKWHPDINKDPNASNMSVQLNEAKNILLDEFKRTDYDEYLKSKTNKTYENIKTHTAKNNSSYKENNRYTNNYREEKMYTKWEYYRDYMKYFNSPLWHKILVSICIFLETILCGFLQIINLLLAYAFCILYNIVEYFINYIVGLVIIVVLFNIFAGNIRDAKEYFILALLFILSILVLALPQLIISFLTEKMPMYLSDLNIYLFKKCVGY